MSGGSALGAVHAAVYTALIGDSTLMALISGVFDEIRADAVFPYVSIGDATELPWDAFGQFGSEATLTLHIWSRAKGMKESQAILDALVAVLDNNTSLSVSGLSTVLLNKEFTETMRESDGITRHGVVRFRVITDGL